MSDKPAEQPVVQEEATMRKDNNQTTKTKDDDKPPAQFMKKQERVRIKVRAKQFSTTRQTLHTFADSNIAKLFTIGDASELPKDEEGFYVLDRAPEGFRYCLNYLRDKETTVPSDEKVRSLMEAEARFYDIKDLIQKLTEGKKPTKKPITIFGGAKDFDGKSAGVEWQKVDLNNSSSYSITFKATFERKPNKAAGKWVLFHKGSNNTDIAPSLFFTQDKQLQLHLSNDQAAEKALKSDELEEKKEYSIAVIVDQKARTGSLWVNAVKASESKLPADYQVVEGPLNIAFSEHIGKKHGFVGSMSAFTIHYSALTEQQLSSA
eukprot:TRINITY_DN84923_c0_g1_i1.p1 TRINITY_DN84923_c0_g1~~TRINITY_DN84923_c0_g1_i1.p1  ORF type:complete len:320 (+),score=79.43 TRINITY_DN84923_c0_g1_i1:34-993(+)